MGPTKEQDQEHPYLQTVPKALWDTLDLALVVEGKSLPVHALIVASQSKVLREAVLNCPDASKSGRSSSQRQLPLPGDEISDVVGTLTYLYRRTFAQQPVKLCSVLEAVRVARFAHKYHCENLAREADAHLSCEAALPTSQLKQGPLLASPKQPGASSFVGTLVNLGSWDALDFLDMAQQLGLPRFSAHCEHWLISQQQVFESEQARLANLQPACLARLARGLAMRVTYNPNMGNYNGYSSYGQPAAQHLQHPSLSTVLGWHGLN